MVDDDGDQGMLGRHAALLAGTTTRREGRRNVNTQRCLSPLFSLSLPMETATVGEKARRRSR